VFAFCFTQSARGRLTSFAVKGGFFHSAFICVCLVMVIPPITLVPPKRNPKALHSPRAGLCFV
jgi:hypothetical protein